MCLVYFLDGGSSTRLDVSCFHAIHSLLLWSVMDKTSVSRIDRHAIGLIALLIIQYALGMAANLLSHSLKENQLGKTGNLCMDNGLFGHI